MNKLVQLLRPSTLKTSKMFGVHSSVMIAVNPLRPNSDLSQTSRCNMKGLSVRAVMRIESMITQVKFS